MGKEGAETTTSELAQGTGLTPERAAQISRENQSGPSSVRTPAGEPTNSSTMLGANFAGRMVPDLLTGLSSNYQIEDCSKENCTVNGNRYFNSTEIPGNRPMPLLHPDGTPVLDPDGKPVVGPDRIDLERIAENLRAQRGWLTIPAALLNFRHGGDLDFQRMRSDDVPGSGGRPIFTRQYQNFANVGLGYVLGSLGLSLDQLSSYSDTYCWMKRCRYDEPMSKQYPSLAERQVRDFEIGFRLYQENHLRAADSGR